MLCMEKVSNRCDLVSEVGGMLERNSDAKGARSGFLYSGKDKRERGQ